MSKYVAQSNVDQSSKVGQIHQKYIEQMNENQKLRSENVLMQKRLNDSVLSKQKGVLLRVKLEVILIVNT
jgi:regulator of replication initiation timing